MRSAQLVLAALQGAAAIRCYNNIDTVEFDKLEWRDRLNRFFQSDYPLLDNFTHSDSFLVDRPDDEGWECLVGQAYPRGWQLFSTCVYFPIRLDFPPETLTLVNLLAGTCNTDKCNNDCNDVPDWFKSRKVNVGFFMILAAFGVVLVGGLIALVARLTDKTPKASFSAVYSVMTRAEWATLALGAVCMSVTGMAVPLMSWNFGRSIGKLADSNIYDEMTKLCLILVYLAAGQLITASIGYAALEPTSVRVAQRWRERYLQSVLRQDIGWFDINRGGGVLASMAEDTASIQKGTGIQLGLFLMNGVSTIGALILAFVWAGYWNVALVCIAVVPLLVLSSGLMLATNDRMNKYENAAYTKAGTISSEALSSMRTVQALNAQDAILERFRYALVPAERAGLLKTVANGCSIGGMNASFMIMYLVSGVYIASIVADKFDETDCNLAGFGSLVAELGGPNRTYEECPTTRGGDGSSFVGDLLATLFNIAFAGMGLGQIGEPFQKIVAARQACSKILTIINRVPTIDSKSDAGEKPSSIEGSVELSDVHFAYPSRPDSKVATGLSLQIPQGSLVALVGPSGSGKSTVMALVQRYYDPLSGTVKLGGHDLTSLNVRYLRSKIGLVGQEPVLFSGSFLENIAYGAPGHTADLEQVIAAAKLANAHEFISKLDKGYDTDVGAGGSKISGGQKQRVAIARAIIRKPSVLLLDEATSALDNESEKVVQAALNELTETQKANAEPTTTIVIAHRLSTIANADAIYVIKEGKLDEQGTHDQLLSKGGLYSQLWKQQGLGKTEESAKKDPKAVSKAAADDPASPMINSTDGGVIQAEVLDEDPAEKKKRLKKEAEEQVKEADQAKGRIWAMQKDDQKYIVSGFFGAIANGLVFPVMAVTFAGMLFMMLSRSGDYMRKQSYYLAAMFGLIAGLLCIPSAALQFYGFGKAGERLTTKIRVMVFEKMLRTELGFFDLPENGAGEVTVRISKAAADVKALTGEALGRNVSMMCMMAFGPFLAMVFSYHLVLALFFVMPFLMVGQIVFLAIMQGQFGKDADESRRSLNIMQEGLTNVRTVAAIQLEGKLIEWYCEEGVTAVQEFKKGLLGFSLVFAGSQGLQFLAWSFLFWFAALAQADTEAMSVFIYIWTGQYVAIFTNAMVSTLVTGIATAVGVSKDLKPLAALCAVGAAATTISMLILYVEDPIKGFFILLSLAAGAITCGLATALVKPIHEAAAPIVGPLVGMATAAALSVVMILNNADNEVRGPNFVEVIFGLFVSVFATFGMANAQIGMTDAQVAAKAVLTTFGFLDQAIQIDGMDDTSGLKPTDIKGAIECKDIHFAYPSRPHLLVAKKFNLTCAAGQTVALVGQSGCGKSTTVMLLERFYDPISGSISLDGHDLRTLNVRYLRRQIGLVGQEPVLFSGSIFSNIAKGLHGEEASTKQVEEAARLANAHDFITGLQYGYQTDVGERGNQLSGGQKQRVAIARAIVSSPKVLLLDEATSALDNESEKIVQQALDELLVAQKRTTLVIAHRLSTIRNADKICFIAKGRVAEEGTHNELLDKGGLYADMVASAER